ncbi:MAG: hypothetical protein H6742_13755 [Alphaproteobacteria bacterium]|nr:hypothetical protein [Alphaproteobacteria bacterium]
MVVLLALLSSSARAELPAGDRWLSTDRVALGLASDGSLCNETADLGLFFDPDGPTGPYPLGGDVLTPGRCFEVWAIESETDSWVMGAPDQGSDLTLSWDEPVDDGAWTWIQGAGGDDRVAVTLRVAIPHGAPVVLFDLSLSAVDDLGDTWVSRSFDPDLDYWVDGNHSTVNLAADPWAVASSQWDERSWALLADGAQAGICSWCAEPSDVAAGGASSTGDAVLGAAVDLGALAAGSSTELRFVYGFGVDAEAAIAAAEDGLSWEVEEAEEEAPVGDSGWSARDGWDQEYAEPDEELTVKEGGGCTAAAAPASLLLALLAPLLIHRRRA